jgi:hypothetical protein
MENAELRKRAARFASLQAAHRALARSVNPSELTPVRDQSRELLIALQDLSARVADEGAGAEEAIAAIDTALDEQTQRTLAILTKIEMSQLRASIPLLVAQNPEEVEGLLDVLLAGDLANGKMMRTLEYLITMLAAEERGGRRVIAREPCQVTRGLRTIGAELSASADEKVLMAERILEDAATQVLQEEEMGEIRDRVRRYKEELGRDLLHPRVLAAAVAYNIAMWNHVAAEIDSSRAIEQLAEELFDPVTRGDERDEARSDADQLLGARGFQDIIAAFRARTLGEGAGVGPATRIAAALPLEILRTQDVDVFEDEQIDESTGLMRDAIVLGLVLRGRNELDADLCELELAPERLADECVHELMARMSELARKHFADSNYGDAFRLSDVKMHSLAAHVPGAATAPRPAAAGRSQRARPDARARRSGAGLGPFLRAIASAPTLVAVVVTVALAALLILPPLSGGESASEASAMAKLSPLLESGRENRGAVPPRFVGQLSPAWSYVGTPERRMAVEEIGVRLAERGIHNVLLMDSSRQVAARYANGTIVVITPREAETLR